MIANTKIETLNLIPVVKAGSGDSHTTDDHRFEVSDRGDRSRSADLQADIFDNGLLLTWRKLESDGPAWRTADHAELFLQGGLVDLDDHAVNFEVQGVTAILKLLEGFDDFVST